MRSLKTTVWFFIATCILALSSSMAAQNGDHFHAAW